MLNRFDYRLIRQFLLFATVAEEKSIRKAAKRLDRHRSRASWTNWRRA